MQSQKVLRLLVIVFSSVFLTAPSVAAELQVERLTWAGVKISNNRTTVLVDAVGKDLWAGNAPQKLVPVESSTPRTYALVTHTHNDHFDPETLKEVLGDKGYVICHQEIASHIASRGLRVISADFYEPVTRGGFVFTAVPASDGLGSKQVSWIVTHRDKRYLHAGDTLWHGNWSLIGAQYGPFDAVFLPINAPVLTQEPASEIPAVMSPEQAVDAAMLLRAKVLVPIHYGLTGSEDYKEISQPLERLKKESARRGLAVSALLPGEVLANKE